MARRETRVVPVAVVMVLVVVVMVVVVVVMVVVVKRRKGGRRRVVNRRELGDYMPCKTVKQKRRWTGGCLRLMSAMMMARRGTRATPVAVVMVVVVVVMVVVVKRRKGRRPSCVIRRDVGHKSTCETVKQKPRGTGSWLRLMTAMTTTGQQKRGGRLKPSEILLFRFRPSSAMLSNKTNYF
jgi:preprotein translocase subunit SecG